MGKMLCQLVKKQSDPTVDIEESDGSPLQYSYFRPIFQELVEKKIDKWESWLSHLFMIIQNMVTKMPWSY